MFEKLYEFLGGSGLFFVSTCLFGMIAASIKLAALKFRKPRFYMSMNQQRKTVGFVRVRDWERARREYWRAVRTHVVFGPSVELPVYPGISVPRHQVIVVSMSTPERIKFLDQLLSRPTVTMLEQRPFLVPELPNTTAGRTDEWVGLHEALNRFSLHSEEVADKEAASRLLGRMEDMAKA